MVKTFLPLDRVKLWKACEADSWQATRKYGSGWKAIEIVLRAEVPRLQQVVQEIDVLTYNEGKTCDAILRHLELRTSASRYDLRYPEGEHHKAPVELTFTLGNQLYAMEHTGIEPFSGHMQMEATADRLFTPISNAVAGRLPQDSNYELQMPVGALEGYKTKELQAIQLALAFWIVTEAPSRQQKSYADYIGGIGPTTPLDVPFPVTLYRFEKFSEEAHFIIKHALQGDTEEMRATRITIALEKKFPKLDHWKRHEGAYTILVLEDNDCQLTNADVVTDTYVPLAMARSDRPDETYMVTTCFEPWTIHPILIGDRTYFDFAQSDEQSYWQLDPNGLVPITNR